MARIVTYSWPADDDDAICTAQPGIADTTLIINGALATKDGVYTPRALFNDYCRKITITSSANDTGVNFSIVGTYQGQEQSESLAGPDTGSTDSDKLYDSIISITPDNDTTGNIKVGTGSDGHTNWFKHNYHSTICALTVQVAVSGTITYTFQTTLEDVTAIATPTVTAGIVVPQADDAEAYTKVMNSVTASSIASYEWPSNYSNLLIDSSGGGSLTAYFLQQGIN